MGSRSFWLVLLGALGVLLRAFGRRPRRPLVGEIISSTTAVVAGRALSLKVLASDIAGIRYEILQITDEDTIVSFHGSTSPFRPIVTPTMVQFGGHSFAPIGVGKAYQVDGTTHQLDAGLHAFSNGHYAGRIF